VHKVEMRHQENGEAEEELVVSNLRPFTLKERTAPHRCPPPPLRAPPSPGGAPLLYFPSLLPRAGEQPPSPGCAGAQVGVHDALDMPILDCALPLRASLLYENGLPVKQARPLASGTERGGGAAAQVSPAPPCVLRPQTSSSEPLLVGETDVVALQGGGGATPARRDAHLRPLQLAPATVSPRARRRRHVQAAHHVAVEPSRQATLPHPGAPPHRPRSRAARLPVLSTLPRPPRPARHGMAVSRLAARRPRPRALFPACGRRRHPRHQRPHHHLHRLRLRLARNRCRPRTWTWCSWSRCCAS
jgi:hypothetical protein